MGFDAGAQHIDQVRDSRHFENESEEFKSDNYSDGLRTNAFFQNEVDGSNTGKYSGSVVSSITAW